MKALFNTLLVALTLAFTSFWGAQAESHKPIGKPRKVAAFQTGIYTTAEGKLQIAVNKETGSPVMVRLCTRDGKEVFVQSLGKRQQAVRLRLDVKGLADGVYEVSVSNGMETITEELTLATEQSLTTTRLVAVQ